MATYKDTKQLDLFIAIASSSSSPKKKRAPLSLEAREKRAERRRGQQASLETREKIAAARRGRLWSDADKQKMSESARGIHRGDKNGHWHGGEVELSCKTCHKPFKVKPYRAKKAKYCSKRCRKEDPDKKSSLYRRMRASVEYKEWRWAVFMRDNFTCQQCHRCGSGVVLNADHIKPFALFPELRFEVSNGRTLCKDCHEKTPTFGVYAWRLKELFLAQDGA